MHGRGVVVSRHSVCGSNLTIFQGVTIGSKRLFHGVQTQKKSISKAPRILNNVTIYAGAAVIGDIEIGNNVTIGANAVVLKDVPSGSTAVGNPAKIKKNVKKR
ncbi:MAG: hypothetical protein J7M10_03695 [Candidatus Cloacimonetes bacterium]|nr:hypothetical protein [Candidatus Cloacimonadota bacterium]